MFVLMETSSISFEQRLYLPLLLEAFFESPVKRCDKIIPYEDIVSELESDTVASRSHIGLGTSGRFTCGPYSNTVSVMLQVEEAKYKRGIEWLRELLYQTQFTTERLQIIAMKMSNHVAQSKRSGNNVSSALMKGLCYVKGIFFPTTNMYIYASVKKSNKKIVSGGPVIFFKLERYLIPNFKSCK